MLKALFEKGSQDAASKEIPYDAFVYLNKSDDYQVSYRKLKTKSILNDEHSRIKIQFEPECDLMTDLYVKMSQYEFSKLTSIEVVIGGQRIDRIEYPQVQLKTLAFLYGKTIRETPDSIYFPLTMAPLHDNNFVPMICLAFHTIEVVFQFEAGVGESISPISLFGKIYLLDHDTREKFAKHTITFNTQQTQTMTVQVEAKHKIEENTYWIPFNYYNHPISCMYLWGLDASLVQTIAFILNQEDVYYEGDVDTLRHYSNSESMEPILWQIKDTRHSLTERPMSTINFSKFDHFHVKLVTTEKLEGKMLYMSSIAHQPIVFSCGMCGLKFSK